MPPEILEFVVGSETEQYAAELANVWAVPTGWVDFVTFTTATHHVVIKQKRLEERVWPCLCGGVEPGPNSSVD